jgi:chromosome segregation ATPase
LINSYEVIPDKETSIKEAENLDESDDKKSESDGDKISEKNDGDELRNGLKTTKDDAKKEESLLYALKNQCDNLTKEHDRLSEEIAKLQEQYYKLVSSGTKKGD